MTGESHSRQRIDGRGLGQSIDSRSGQRGSTLKLAKAERRMIVDSSGDVFMHSEAKNSAGHTA